MSTTKSPSQRIIEEVTSWDGVAAGPGGRGELAFKVGPREIGHLHGDHAAHFVFPRELWVELEREGRITFHPVFPKRQGPAARAIRDDGDVEDVITLMRHNYERLAALRTGEAA
jgi:hypothetical protein